MHFQMGHSKKQGQPTKDTSKYVPPPVLLSELEQATLEYMVGNHPNHEDKRAEFKKAIEGRHYVNGTEGRGYIRQYKDYAASQGIALPSDIRPLQEERHR